MMPPPLYATSEYSFEHGSSDYWQAVTLRQRVLREPLGLTLTVAELLLEGPPMVHYGIFDGMGEIIIACATGVPVGAEAGAGIWKIRQVAVHADYRGQGFGTRVMAGLEHQLRFCGAVTQFELHARQEVSGFYENCGYRIVGEPFVEIGLPHVKMTKSV